MIIINSILDTDLYKLTMQQAVCQLYPKAEARYEFINRGKTRFPEGFGLALKNELHYMKSLRLTEQEKNFLLEKCPYLTPVYVDFLSSYQFNPNEVQISQAGGNLKITIEGPWYRTILWEVPLMAMISELYFKFPGGAHYRLAECHRINREKAKLFKKERIGFADFGTRRRFSFEINLIYHYLHLPPFILDLLSLLLAK